MHHLQNFHVLKLKVCEKCDAVFRMQREQDTQHTRGYANCFGVQRAAFFEIGQGDYHSFVSAVC